MPLSMLSASETISVKLDTGMVADGEKDMD